MSKTRASCFIRGSRHLETIKALGLRPRAFICFSVSGTPDETLAPVFDTLLQPLVTKLPSYIKNTTHGQCNPWPLSQQTQ